MNDPTAHECVGCLAALGPPNLWLCDLCVSIAVELGYEADPFTHPGNDVTRTLWNKMMERQRAKSKKRSDGQARSPDSA